jgi:hypothetical protein
MYRTKMAKRCSKRRSLRNHRRTRRGGWVFRGGDSTIAGFEAKGGGRKKMMRTRRRTRRGGVLDSPQPTYRHRTGGGYGLHARGGTSPAGVTVRGGGPIFFLGMQNFYVLNKMYLEKSISVIIIFRLVLG